MHRLKFPVLSKGLTSAVAALTMVAFLVGSTLPTLAMDALRGGAPPHPLPLFPPDNWWNVDISTAPVDSASASYIAFINNGDAPDAPGLRRRAARNLDLWLAVHRRRQRQFRSARCSSSTGTKATASISTRREFSVLPDPDEAITQAHWIEGGEPGNVDLRSSQDRHLLIVDKDRNISTSSTTSTTTRPSEVVRRVGRVLRSEHNNRRPDTWTSADAAGLAILPGLVRYDEALIPPSRDRTRVSRDRAGDERLRVSRVAPRRIDGWRTADGRAAAPEGEREDAAHQRSQRPEDLPRDAEVRPDRRRQRLGPVYHRHLRHALEQRRAQSRLRRADRERLRGHPAGIQSVDFHDASVGFDWIESFDGNRRTVYERHGYLDRARASRQCGSQLGKCESCGHSADFGNNRGGNASTSLTVTTSSVSATTIGNISASYAGVTKSAILTVNPAPAVTLQALTLNPTTVTGSATPTGTVTLSANAPAGGAEVALYSSRPSRASVPAKVTVAAGSRTATFSVSTRDSKRISVTISANYSGVRKSATLTIQK